jgi:hypothetical protein
MRCAIVSLHTPDIKDYADITAASKENYCKKWGVDFINYTEKFDDRPPAFSKVVALIKNIGNYDILLWIDADAMITDMDFDLFAELIKRKEKILLTKDNGGINTGVFAVKKWAKNYLKKWDSMSPAFESHPWWDQAAFISLYNSDKKLKNKVGFLNKTVYNSYINEGVGVILHSPGTSKRERINLFSNYEEHSRNSRV